MENWLITFGSSKGNETHTLDITARNYEEAKIWAENETKKLNYFNKVIEIKRYDEIKRKTEKNN